jgi:cob(I)alamin adenosyltransferase
METKQRLLQVYTGNGKGKTTAALGLCMRAAGRGWRCLVIQFMKGLEYGELFSFENVPLVTIEQYGAKGFVDKCGPSPEDKSLAATAMKRATEAFASAEFDMVVLDEVNVAIDFGLVKLDDVIELLSSKPEGVEVVCTGRYAPQQIIDMADLVTEMTEVRHPFRNNIPARKGIEF